MLHLKNHRNTGHQDVICHLPKSKIAVATVFGLKELKRTLFLEVIRTAFAPEFAPADIFILLGSN